MLLFLKINIHRTCQLYLFKNYSLKKNTEPTGLITFREVSHYWNLNLIRVTLHVSLHCRVFIIDVDNYNSTRTTRLMRIAVSNRYTLYNEQFIFVKLTKI